MGDEPYFSAGSNKYAYAQTYSAQQVRHRRGLLSRWLQRLSQRRADARAAADRRADESADWRY